MLTPICGLPFEANAMGTRDSRVDTYIAKSPEYARPILTHLRELVHKACPEVEETMKWSRPHFLYKGMFCGMSAFNEHCAFGFWKGSLIVDKSNAPGEDEKSMGQFGRITRLADLPSDKVLTGYIHQAMKLNDGGVKSPARSKPKSKVPRELVVPDDLAASLAANEAARAGFERFTPSQKREYVEWLEEAKTEATRTRRLTTAVEWMAEGKTRNWKYQNC
jgi:uncharacterized protein YdeI (YjbR/CyaY-like superfamily)